MIHQPVDFLGSFVFTQPIEKFGDGNTIGENGRRRRDYIRPQFNGDGMAIYFIKLPICANGGKL